MRKRAASAIAFALTVFGLGQSMSGWQSPVIGAILMGAGVLIGATTLLESLRPRSAVIDRCYAYFGIGTRQADERASIALANTLTAQRQQLAENLELKAEHARRMLRTIESGYCHGLFEPNTLVLEPNLYDLSTEASQWATSVSDKLREEGMFDDAMEFAVPDEIDPTEVTAYHVERILAGLLKRLEGIIHEPRRRA